MNAELLITPDEELERRIDHEALLLATVKTREERQMIWAKLKELIAQRSPAQIARMEAEIF
jgi:hypothetical protein